MQKVEEGMNLGTNKVERGRSVEGCTGKESSVEMHVCTLHDQTEEQLIH